MLQVGEVVSTPSCVDSDHGDQLEDNYILLLGELCVQDGNTPA